MMSAYLALLGVLTMGAPGNLLTNADFEQGMQGWSISHDWYAQPPGGGLSQITVAEGEGRDGSKALKIAGQGKRGLAMQIYPVRSGKYRVTGWIRCEGLDAGDAGILCEWMSREDKWLSGDRAATITGTQDWQRFETVVTAPDEARSVHFDLLTTVPNHGTVWFDDLEFVRVPSDLPAPEAPEITVETPAGAEGCLQVAWDPQRLTRGAMQLLVYCETKPLAEVTPLIPRAVLDAADSDGRIESLDVGTAYHVAARLVNADGAVSELSAETTVTVRDRQAPRPGWLAAERVADGVRLSWSPHVLDTDVARVSFCLPGAGDQIGRTLRTVDAAGLYREPRPFYCTAPWLSLDLPLRTEDARVGVYCEDAAGNRGEVAWTDVQMAWSEDELQSCATWMAPPTANIARGTTPPPAPEMSWELRLMAGHAKGCQLVLRPEQDLHRVRVSFEAARHEDGAAEIAPRWFAYHFVEYVNLERNSRATPAEELVWPAPADYPDELGDEPLRDLAANQTQPIYLRFTAPPGTRPGAYQGRGFVESDEGRREFRFTLRVEPVVLPDPVRLRFVYWFSWDAPCKEFGVSTTSADGWRVLYRLGELMRAHHQRVVVVPWSLTRTWRDAAGNLVHDFRDFDRFVATFQAAGVDQLFCLSHFGSRTTGEWECPTMGSHGHPVRSLETGEPLPQMDSVDLLPALQAHIEEMGLLDRFTVHVADEPIPVNLESYKQLSARVHAAAPRLRRIDAIHVPDLQGSLEVWVPQLNYFEQWKDQFRAAQKAGNEVWFYIAWVPQGKYPNRMIDSAAIKPRVLHWLNALEDTDGYLHWALNHWSISLMSLQSPGDQYICWPSQRFIANSSLRYEAEREGLEDCELLFMVRDKLMAGGATREAAQARMEAIGRQAVRGVEDYTRSWQELENTRRELLLELTR